MNLRKLIDLFEAVQSNPGTGASGFPLAGRPLGAANPVKTKAASSAGNEALKGQVIAAGAPNTTTPTNNAAAAMASKSAAPAMSAREADMQRRMAATKQAGANVPAGTSQTSSGPGGTMTVTKTSGAPQGREPGLVNALGIQGQATNVAGASALTGGAGTPTQPTAEPAAPATAPPGQAAMSYAGGQASAAAPAPAPTAAAPTPTPASNNAAAAMSSKPASAAPKMSMSQPTQGFSGTGMASNDFEESVEEDLDADPATARLSKAPLTAGNKTDQSKLPSMYDVERANRKEIKSQFTDPKKESPYNKDTRALDKGSKTVNTIADFEESVDYELSEMLRLSGMTLNEKAVSKQQQKFMGMVHAMQKGEKVKGASKELKAAAKGMSKKDAKDFASTKHKGLPKKVTEGVVLEAGSTLEHIVNKFKYETKKFINGEDLDSDLYEALFDYYSDNGEIPYGVAKARDGDPYTWIENRFEDELSMMGYPRTHDELNYRGDQDLTELALLAGLSEGTWDDIKTTIDKATLPKGMHDQYDRLQAQKAEREFQKSDSAFSDKAGTRYDRFGNPKEMIGLKAQDYLDPKPNRDRDLYSMATGSKPAAASDKVNLPRMKEAGEKFTRPPAPQKQKPTSPSMSSTTPADTKDTKPTEPNRIKKGPPGGDATEPQPQKQKDPFDPSKFELTECGDMGMEDKFNVSTNMSSDGTRSVNISAQGSKADDLLQMLKMAGMRPHDDHEDRAPLLIVSDEEEMMEADRETEYANTPDEEYQNIETQFVGGDGEVAGMEKQMHRGGSARFSDNPLTVDEMLDEELDAMLESILLRDDKEKPRLKITKDGDRHEISSSTGRVKATMQSGKPTSYEPAEKVQSEGVMRGDKYVDDAPRPGEVPSPDEGYRGPGKPLYTPIGKDTGTTKEKPGKNLIPSTPKSTPRQGK